MGVERENGVGGGAGAELDGQWSWNMKCGTQCLYGHKIQLSWRELVRRIVPRDVVSVVDEKIIETTKIAVRIVAQAYNNWR